MINAKDIASFLIPFPDENSALNKVKHMYVCIKIDADFMYFVKCQTYRQYHDNVGSPPVNRIVEARNPERNPFLRATLLDLDKVFVIPASDLPKMKYIGEVSNALFSDIVLKLGEPEYINVSVS